MHASNLVSVVITCFNLERFIGQAIESVLNQDFTGVFEIIVVDDCSIDGSSEVIKSYACVKYIKTESNVGVLNSTLVGLKNSIGTYIFFLDGDDVWERNKISLAMHSFERDRKLVFITHDLSYINESGDLITSPSIVHEALYKVASPQLLSDYVKNGILHHMDYVWLGSAFAINVSLFNLVEFVDFMDRIVDTKNTYQDWPLAFWIACHDDLHFHFISAKLLKYRLHGNNYSGDNSNKEKAIRNYTRSRNTLFSIYKISVLFERDEAIVANLCSRYMYYSYLVDLYGGIKIKSIVGFTESVPFFIKNRIIAKELARFIIVFFFGQEIMNSVKQLKRRFFF